MGEIKQHRVDSLMSFLACEFSDSEEASKNLLTEENLKNACRIDEYADVNVLKGIIYATYTQFGFDSAKGVFEVTVLESFNSQQ